MYRTVLIPVEMFQIMADYVRAVVRGDMSTLALVKTNGFISHKANQITRGMVIVMEETKKGGNTESIINN